MKPGGKERNEGAAEELAGSRYGHLRNPLVRLFAARLWNWRRAQGKALKEVAGDLGVSIAIVSEWEHGHRFPSVNHLQAVTRYTGISAAKFFCEVSERGCGGGKSPGRKICGRAEGGRA